jgi:ubiquinone/menaquinone biosynthesis C-methylase UbiE
LQALEETMTDALANFDLRDEIKAYWSERAATFDDQPGHEIFSEAERAAWHNLIRKHVGEGRGRTALDLACGTAVVSHLMDDLGFHVTGMDWSEPMLERARAKAASRKRGIRFVMGDAENTMEPDASYDVIINRHLVWTLVDPQAAFREWFRVLKPGGKLLVIDGDFVNKGLVARFASWLASKLNGPQDGHGAVRSAEMMKTHRSILSRVHFSEGARANSVASLLAETGFSPVRVDYAMRPIHRAQAANFSFLKGLERSTQHRYAILATKPQD